MSMLGNDINQTTREESKNYTHEVILLISSSNESEYDVIGNMQQAMSYWDQWSTDIIKA